ncbi:hypothetical protein OKW38_003242 [Paraburkholderia sp. MM5496-R1]|uniref:hypothetical protein n=1 Tax=unclassified Paraburkholderia TaxID=2615204 RepID=UPI003D19B0F8
MKKAFPLVLFFPFVSFALDGTGSVDFDSAIIPLLNKNSVLKGLVLCNFDIVGDPMGTRIGDIQSKALGGDRIGPYSMWANWHGNSGVKPVILTINTHTDFIDARGKKVGGDLKKAIRIQEYIESVTIEPPEKDQPESVPGGLKHSIEPQTCSEKNGQRGR